MADLGAILTNPIVAFLLRAALGAYVVFMARGFYADPFGYFRKWMPRFPEHPWMRLAIRGAACFCVWGGCFILSTAVATQVFGLHGVALAVALVLLAAIATWLLLPGSSAPMEPEESGNDSLGRMK